MLSILACVLSNIICSIFSHCSVLENYITAYTFLQGGQMVLLGKASNARVQRDFETLADTVRNYLGLLASQSIHFRTFDFMLFQKNFYQNFVLCLLIFIHKLLFPIQKKFLW